MDYFCSHVALIGPQPPDSGGSARAPIQFNSKGAKIALALLEKRHWHMHRQIQGSELWMR